MAFLAHHLALTFVYPHRIIPTPQILASSLEIRILFFNGILPKVLWPINIVAMEGCNLLGVYGLAHQS
jgi:hypothetical protein